MILPEKKLWTPSRRELLKGAGAALASGGWSRGNQNYLNWLWWHFKPTDTNLFCFSSTNGGTTWASRTCNYTPRSGTIVRDPNALPLVDQQNVVIAYTSDTFGVSTTSFDICRNTDAACKNFSYLATIDTSSIVSGANARSWGPRWVWYAGNLYVTIACSANGDNGPFQLYYAQVLDLVNFSSIGPWQQITGTGLPSSMFDNDIFPYGAQWLMFVKNELNGKFIEVAQSNNPFSGYSMIRTGNWAGFGTPREGEYVNRMSASQWWIILDAQGSGYTRSNSTSDDPTGSWGAPFSMTTPYTPQNGKNILCPGWVVP